MGTLYNLETAYAQLQINTRPTEAVRGPQKAELFVFLITSGIWRAMDHGWKQLELQNTVYTF